MKGQTFLAKVSSESLKRMDEHINSWLERNKIEPKMINQVFGYQRDRSNDDEEPVVITTVWY